MQNLLDARKNTRKTISENKKKMEEINDPEIIKKLKNVNSVLNKRQLAYKVSANSMYGAMGVKKGYIPFIEGARCITYMGTQNIKKVADLIPSKYNGELIYGDTDSNYIHFPHLKDPKKLWDYSEKVAKEISTEFLKPMKLEFEEVIYRRFMILTKKRYMYQSTNREGDKNDKVGKKGVLLVRRDNCKFIRDIYEQVIFRIFNKEIYQDVVYFITQKLNEMFSKTLPIEDFIITKSIKNTDTDTMPVITGNDETDKLNWEKWENERLIKDITDKSSNKINMGSYKVSTYPKTEEDIKFALEEKNVSNRREFYIKCLPAHVQLAEKIKDRGIICSAGSRIEYVLIDKNDRNIDKFKQCEKNEYYEYAKKHSDNVKLGFLDYLKLLINPLDEVLNVIFKDSPYFTEKFTKKQYEYRLLKYKNLLELKDLFKPSLIFE
jgi:DNA polymerase elongation subunit (family B)